MVLILKPGVGQCIAIHATLKLVPGISSLLISPLPVLLPAFFFSKTSPEFFAVLSVANIGSCVGLQNINRPQNMLFFWVCVPRLWIESELWFERKKLVVL